MLLAAYGGLALISSAKSASVLALPAGHRAELGVAALVIEHLAATLTLPLGARGRMIAAVVGVMQCPPTLIAADEVAHVFAWWPLAIDEARALIACCGLRQRLSMALVVHALQPIRYRQLNMRRYAGSSAAIWRSHLWHFMGSVTVRKEFRYRTLL